jgi:hypothetical protein
MRRGIAGEEKAGIGVGSRIEETKKKTTKSVKTQMLSSAKHEAVAVNGYAWRLPQKGRAKRIRNETCLSRRRVCFISRFARPFCGNPAGAASRRSPFFGSFLWRSKERD